VLWRFEVFQQPAGSSKLSLVEETHSPYNTTSSSERRVVAAELSSDVDGRDGMHLND
jgi:hypothetical protein